MTPAEYSPEVLAVPRAVGQADKFDRIPYWLAFGAAVSILFSIAVSQILLGAGMLALLTSRKRLHFPPILLPLCLFFASTVLADLLSGDARRGIPQIRKFFVFGIVLLLFNTFSSLPQIRNLLMAWTACATLAGLLAMGQFAHRWSEAIELQANPYDYVLDGRIMGFSSHWMTYGGQQMIVLLILLSWLLFEQSARWKIAGWVCAGVIWIALVLGLTRSIFLLGVPAGALLLVWNYKRWLLLAAPSAALLMFLVAPIAVRERIFSSFQPHGETDSNSRRSIMARTGWRMIQAHPWFGVGPEQVQPQFNKYLPADVPRPLPKGWYGHLHDLYLQYAAERGLPGLACVLWIIGKMARDFGRAVKASRPDPDVRFVLYGALAVIAAVLAEGFFEYNLGDTEVLTMFLATTTCAYVAIQVPKEA